MTSLLQTYTLYRNVGRALNSKIMQSSSFSRDVLQQAASLLGIERGNTLVFESEDETSVLMDFALHDVLIDDGAGRRRNAVQLYKQNVGWNDELEHKLLEALSSSRASLFRIFAINHDECTLYVKDVLQDYASHEPTMKDLVGINLVDVNLSQTAYPGPLLFTRVVPFEEFSMTSGAGFIFDGQLQRFLTKRYKVLARKVRCEHEAARRYVAFYRLNAQYGSTMRLA